LNVTKHFPVCDNRHQESEQLHNGYFRALYDVSLSIDKCECVIIAGANGSGKSLLMSIIAGLEDPTSGTVEINAKVGLVFQEADAQILGETPREDIALGPKNMKLKKEEIIFRVNAALKDSGLESRADFPAHSLSGGEKRRLAAAGVLAMDADIIIFDEPYANLDYPGIVQVNNLFIKLKNEGKTVIILTHELEKCMALCSRFIVLCNGKKVFDGSLVQALECEPEKWGIRHPLRKTACKLEDLLWA